MAVKEKGYGCAVFTKVFAIGEGLLPHDPKLSFAMKYFNPEKGLLLGLALLLAGAIMLLHAFWRWRQAGYGVLPDEANLRRLIPAVTCLMIGVQTIFSSFFLSVLGLRTRSRQPPGSLPPLETAA